MIISLNKKPTFEEFTHLVEKATQILNDHAKKHNAYYLTRNAQKLEDDVVNALEQAACDTPFAGTIKKVSGQHFPDIVAAKFFGVEVKSSKDNKWETLGGSINESTRVHDVERIFLTFGKLTTPVEFKSRPYQDCLSDIVVTHYPRYKINMKLKDGETIFDKLNIDYDSLRKKDNPVAEISRYYKELLKPGERLWWLNNNDETDSTIASNSIKVRLWNALTQTERQQYTINAFAFFPEIFGNAHDKYDNLSLWLVSNYGVLAKSLRDVFTAGGRATIQIHNETFNVSRMLYNMYNNLDKIKELLLAVPSDELKDLWNVSHIAHDRFKQWKTLVIRQDPSAKKLLKQIN
ncbi:MAG: hypothetical protein J5679_03280 [Alphaproteobacteria bacterium]|nr:hypothetical protein [Alphaproteobacteria bacterium]